MEGGREEERERGMDGGREGGREGRTAINIKRSTQRMRHAKMVIG